MARENMELIGQGPAIDSISEEDVKNAQMSQEQTEMSVEANSDVQASQSADEAAKKDLTEGDNSEK